MSKKRTKPKGEREPVALYHIVKKDDGFIRTKEILHDLTLRAQRENPGYPRFLYLDVEGHRNPAGGLDDAMFDIMTHFLIKTLGTYPTEMHLPVGHFVNRAKQNNDVPEDLSVFPDVASSCPDCQREERDGEST